MTANEALTKIEALLAAQDGAHAAHVQAYAAHLAAGR